MGRVIGNTLACVLAAFCVIDVLVLFGQDFGFPEVGEEDKAKKNANNKNPVFLPEKCNENEYFYPGDNKDDWVCDCQPGHLYYPKTDRCYRAYRRGPCQPNELLSITAGNYIPVCQPNVCEIDGVVSFKNACHALDKAGPCLFPELSYVVGVNTNTLELECIKLTQVDLSSRFSEDESDSSTRYYEGNKCFKGSKHTVRGRC